MKWPTVTFIGGTMLIILSSPTKKVAIEGKQPDYWILLLQKLPICTFHISYGELRIRFSSESRHANIFVDGNPLHRGPQNVVRRIRGGANIVEQVNGYISHPKVRKILLLEVIYFDSFQEQITLNFLTQGKLKFLIEKMIRFPVFSQKKTS